MIIDAISNGIVIDHITAGKAMYLYKVLELDKLDCSVALLKNVVSNKLGRKDIIKIDRILNLDWDVIGYVDPGHYGELHQGRPSRWKSASSSSRRGSKMSSTAKTRAA